VQSVRFSVLNEDFGVNLPVYQQYARGRPENRVLILNEFW